MNAPFRFNWMNDVRGRGIRVALFMLMLLCGPGWLAAQATADTAASTPQTASLDSSSVAPAASRGFPARLVADFGRQATTPFHMDRADALTLGGGAVIVTGLMLEDRAFDITARNLRANNQWISDGSSVVTQLGSTPGIVGAGLFAGYSFLFGNDYDRRTSELLGEALITTSVWVRLLKYVGGRRRPYTFDAQGYDAGSQWLGPLQHIRNPNHLSSGYFESFPSGHSSTAFALATVFAERYGRTPAVPVIAYTLATMVGLSRVVEHDHWMSDVFVGACIGYLCAKDVVAHGGEGPDRRSELIVPERYRLRAYPFLTGDGGGLGLSVIF
ncbi:MAG: phosphatase PAP2 family protein [Bacteroidetes bacterium]|nr:phosphatase PAP2 family protein [Bacteroidota bacterium]